MTKSLWFLLLLPAFLKAQTAAKNKPPLRYSCNFTNKPPLVDGMEDACWKNASWTPPFLDIEGEIKPIPAFETKVKMLWDDEFLYIYAKLEEPALSASLTRHDAIIYRDNDFEVFIDPNNDQQQYFEFEINALNTVMELYMDKPYNKGGRADLSWNAEGLQTAVRLIGTLNDPSDKDSGWTVEMAIPFAVFQRPERLQQPKSGDNWRVNFSRVQWKQDIVDGKYQNRKDGAGKNLPEDNWVWSPHGRINMHIPELWGYLQFIKNQ